MLVYGRSTAAPHVRKIKKSRRGPFFPILYPRHPKRRQSPHSQAPPVPAIASQIAGFKFSATQNNDVRHSSESLASECPIAAPPFPKLRRVHPISARCNPFGDLFSQAHQPTAAPPSHKFLPPHPSPPPNSTPHESPWPPWPQQSPQRSPA